VKHKGFSSLLISFDYLWELVTMANREQEYANLFPTILTNQSALRDFAILFAFEGKYATAMSFMLTVSHLSGGTIREDLELLVEIASKSEPGEEINSLVYTVASSLHNSSGNFSRDIFLTVQILCACLLPVWRGEWPL
jgi:hypothetical protein